VNDRFEAVRSGEVADKSRERLFVEKKLRQMLRIPDFQIVSARTPGFGLVRCHLHARAVQPEPAREGRREPTQCGMRYPVFG
jgi:hypothetical protein